MALTGGHNALNVAAALACVRAVRRRARIPSAPRSAAFHGLAAPHRARRRGAWRPFLRRLEGHQRGRRRYCARRAARSRVRCSSPAAATRAGATGRSSTRSNERAARSSFSARPPTRSLEPSGTRVPVRLAADHGRSRPRRSLAREARRRRPALASLLELRHVSRLQASRRRVRPRREGTREGGARHDPQECPPHRRYAARGAPRCEAQRVEHLGSGRSGARRDRRRVRRLRRGDGLQRQRGAGDRSVSRPAVFPETAGGLRRRRPARDVDCEPHRLSPPLQADLPGARPRGLAPSRVRRRLRALGRRRRALALHRARARPAGRDGEGRARHLARLFAREEGRAG